MVRAGAARRPGSPAEALRSHAPQLARTALVPLLAAAAVLTGTVDLVSAVVPADPDRVAALNHVLPVWLIDTSSGAAAVVGIVLVLAAHGLRRRKRRAWRLATGLAAASVLLNLAKGLDVEEAVLAVALLVGLLLARSRFPAAGDPRSRLWAPVLLLGVAAVAVVAGVGLVEGERARTFGSPGFGAVLLHVIEGLVGVQGPVQFTTERTSDLVRDVLLGLGVATGLVPAYVLLRPAEPAARLHAEDELRLRELLARHGTGDSLGYFALRRDKAAVFSPSGKAAVSYRVLSGVMLAAGDPIGDPEAWPGAIEAFLAEARRHAWVPAVMGCSERAGEVWAREAGMRALELGDEAVVDTAAFSLEGRAMRNVRQMVRRVERNGYRTRISRVRDLDPALVADARRQADAWRDGEVERGFSMALGRLGDPADGDCVLVTAHAADDDGEDHVRALLHFVPWGTDGLSLDVMRRDRAADAGLNELMIARALEAAPSLGVGRVSLNFAVFRSALDRGSRLGAGPVLRAWRSLLLVASRWWQIESLFRFNAKFSPVWEPRFVCYPAARDLPRIALAALEAEAFLVWPEVRPFRRRSPAAAAHPAPAALASVGGVEGE